MDLATDVTPVLTGQVTSFGTQALVVIAAIIGLAAGLYFISWGFGKVKGGLKKRV
jgi:hypothetical protein